MRYLMLFCLLLSLSTSPVSLYASEAAAKRPNIVMVVVDDMRFDEFGLGGHSFLQTPHIDNLAQQGARFTRSYAVTPLCSPNRASLLTGQYPSRHGVLDNTARSSLSHRLKLFPRALQDIGYRTAHVGKWHMGNDPSERPGYDYWVSYSGQGKLFNPELYEHGKLGVVEGYITDILTDRVQTFIEESTEQPFFVYLGHKAIHPEASQRNDGSADLSVKREFKPAQRHEGRYRDAVSPLTHYTAVTQDRGPVSQSLAIRQQLADRDLRWRNWIQSGFSVDTVRKRAEMMLAVDESLGRILATLQARALLDNTLIIFTSDNGYFFGEHNLTIERRYPYEEAVRTPLIIRPPSDGTTVKNFTHRDMLVASVDLAPTILDYAGIDIPSYMQGYSLHPILEKGEAPKRDRLLMEHFAHENPFIWTAKINYKAIISGAYKLIKWTHYENEYELYNLYEDPKEQHNLAKHPTHQAQLNQMIDELRAETINIMGF